jgi:Domain of unknown function (DUF4337)
MTDQLADLKDLVAAIKADHQAQKDKEKRDSWTKYVSLWMICLAVLAALATQKGAGFSSATMKQLNEATFNQALASDQWAFFQAKGIKQSLYERELDHVARGQIDTALATKIHKYDAEKKEISNLAKSLEAKRDTARIEATRTADKSRQLGLATTLFQIAIALGAVCMVVKKKLLWFASMAPGAAAAVQMFLVLSGK